MKKILFSMFATTAVFAAPQEILSTAPTTSYNEVPALVYEDPTSPKEGFFYFRFSTAGSDFNDPNSIHPGLGIGYRRLVGKGAIDLSFNGLGFEENRSSEFVWSAPKISYVHYFSTSRSQTVYLGGGLGWGGIKKRDGNATGQKFTGIIPNLLLGYEFLHNSTALGFTELSVSQPALAVHTKGAFPGPSVELSFGAGF